MILSDADIRSSLNTGQLTISPYRDDQLGPASYDFRLSNLFCEVGCRSEDGVFRFSEAEETLELEPRLLDTYIIRAGHCVLGLTEEYFGFDNRLVGKAFSKSSNARLFLRVASCAGYGDPGFRGHFVLEIVNHSPFDIELLAGQRIGQMVFTRLEHPAAVTYDVAGHYAEQMDFALDRWVKALKKIGQLR